MAISLVIAGANALSNDVLRRAFKRRAKQFNVLACVLTRRELVEQLAKSQPDVVVVSAGLEGKPSAGLEALRDLRLTRSSTRLIVLLGSSEAGQVIEAFAQGARGVLCKSAGFEALCKCIRSVHAGQVWADSNQLGWVVKALEEREPARAVPAPGNSQLTGREEEIVRMVAEGLPNGEICATLGLSAHTVKNHLSHIYEKLGVSNRVELLFYALSKRGGPGSGYDRFQPSDA